ncbi:MAG TPA: MBL fold metallo-hydrolase [Nocardioidaceae bacterium]|nr:MBL fold metallo-hydrolase [Nocardioidaceae bacterium]
MSGPALGSAGAWSGGSVGAWAECVLAPNPGPMTLDGTNTWVLSAPGSQSAVAIDPGPLDAGHLRRVVEVAERRGARIEQVLLTHGHHDHSEGAAELARLAGARGVRALDPAFRLGDEGLRDGDTLALADGELRVVGTPGHTSDSLSFLLTAGAGSTGGSAGSRAALLTGDTVLGRGTTVVAHPDGQLGPYLDSLRRLRELADSVAQRLGAVAVWPGHGPVLDDALAILDGYLKHREERLAQVREALAAGDETPRQVVERVYADVDRILWPAAELSVRAQLDYLRATA